MASPVGHTLLGVSIYLASLPREAKKVSTPMLVFSAVAANSMDFDFLVSAALGSNYHHAHMHTLAFALFFSASAMLVNRLIAGRFSLRFFFLCLLLSGSHAAMDFFTVDTSKSYGLMLFWPVTDKYFISPFPFFLDIWRGTPALIFGYHNIEAGLRETAAGGFLLFGVTWFKGIWFKQRSAVLVASLVFGTAAVLFHNPLNRAAEEQMTEYLGKIETSGVKTQTGRDGILFSGFRDGNKDIFLIKPDGSDLRRLTNHEAEDEWPVWSFDGKSIVFQSFRYGNWDIFRMSSDGSDLKRLTRETSEDKSPCWSKDGKRIIFSSERNGKSKVFSMNANDGSDIVQLSPNGSARDLLPAVCPKTGAIAYTSRSPLFPLWHIYRIMGNSDEPERISPQSGCRAKWSPDGKYLAYVSDGHRDASDIWIFSSAGRNLRRAVSTMDYDYDPCWSPDGQKLCFARGNNGKSKWDLWIVNIDGTGLKPLTQQQAGDRHPCWR